MSINLERPPLTETRKEWSDWINKVWTILSPDKGLIIPVKTDATRGAAGQAGRVIFNSDDGQLNIDDGTNWTLSDGSTT